MIYNQDNIKNLRDLFCDAIVKVFGSLEAFLDFLENDECSTKYDCFIDCNGENYIIDRETGDYINWYKLTHIGRDIHISTFHTYEDIPGWINWFLTKFKESEEQNGKIEV